MNLTCDEKLRYSRHLNLNNFSEESQLKLKNSKVLVVGAGGLASPLLMYLVSSGIGNITVIDFDTVSLENLQRQIIHSENNIGKNKAISAKQHLLNINSLVNITTLEYEFSKSNSDIVKDFDIVVVTVDDLNTRNIINEASLKNKILQVSAAAVSYEGWVSVFNPNKEESPCYNCLHHFGVEAQFVKKAKDIGVFAPLVGIIGTMEASEVVKELLNFGNSLTGVLRTYNAFYNHIADFKLHKTKGCICSK